MTSEIVKMSEIAGNWILNSGIQRTEGPETLIGGFNSWKDSESGKCPFIYSEITGYGITSLLYLAKSECDTKKAKDIIGRANLAAEWLENNAMDASGGFYTRYFPGKESFEDSRLYTFDAGMILYGLVCLYNSTKNPDILGIAIKVAGFLINAQRKDGNVFAIYDAKQEKYLDVPGKWSTHSACHHAKTAMGMIELFNITRDDKYKSYSEKVCEAAMRYQAPDGRYDIEGETHMHPHSYAAEGLLYVGKKIGRDDFIDSASKAAEFALRKQAQDGGIPFLYAKDGVMPFQRTDILSQVLRLGSVLVSMGRLDKSFEPNLKRLLERLSEFQDKSGGFVFGYDFDGRRMDHLNSWCTMFAMQALDCADNLFNGGREMTISENLFV
jgi:hypothetical protein